MNMYYAYYILIECIIHILHRKRAGVRAGGPEDLMLRYYVLVYDNISYYIVL